MIRALMVAEPVGCQDHHTSDTPFSLISYIPFSASPAYVFFKILPCRFMSLSHQEVGGKTRQLDGSASSSIKVLVFTPVSAISPNHSRLPLTGSDLHLSSSPSRHYFPRYRTHHMMKSAVVSRDRCSLPALAGHRWGSSPWSTAQT